MDPITLLALVSITTDEYLVRGEYSSWLELLASRWLYSYRFLFSDSACAPSVCTQTFDFLRRQGFPPPRRLLVAGGGLWPEVRECAEGGVLEFVEVVDDDLFMLKTGLRIARNGVTTDALLPTFSGGKIVWAPPQRALAPIAPNVTIECVNCRVEDLDLPLLQVDAFVALGLVDQLATPEKLLPIAKKHTGEDGWIAISGVVGEGASMRPSDLLPGAPMTTLSWSVQYLSGTREHTLEVAAAWKRDIP